eukprot:1185835-Prorocentrum_minimum.AAC.4
MITRLRGQLASDATGASSTVDGCGEIACQIYSHHMHISGRVNLKVASFLCLYYRNPRQGSPVPRRVQHRACEL